MTPLSADSAAPAVRAAVFRSHRFPQERHSAHGLYGRIAEEWLRLATSPAVARTVRRWHGRSPALAGLASVGEIVDAIDAACPERKDELFRALLDLFHDGQQLAGRILLQAMLPKLSRYARTRRPADSSDVDHEDRRGNTISAFWSVLGRPGEGRTANIAGSLALDTLNILTAHTRVASSEEPVGLDLFNPAWEVGGTVRAKLIKQHIRAAGAGPDTSLSVLDRFEPSPSWTLDRLTSWGIAHGVITSTDADALLAVDAGWPSPMHEIAASLNISASCLRQRCSRATRALASAVRAQTQDSTRLELVS